MALLYWFKQVIAKFNRENNSKRVFMHHRAANEYALQHNANNLSVTAVSETF